MAAVAEWPQPRPTAATEGHRLAIDVDLGPILIHETEGPADDERAVAIGRDHGRMLAGHLRVDSVELHPLGLPCDLGVGNETGETRRLCGQRGQSSNVRHVRTCVSPWLRLG